VVSTTSEASNSSATDSRRAVATAAAEVVAATSVVAASAAASSTDSRSLGNTTVGNTTVGGDALVGRESTAATPLPGKQNGTVGTTPGQASASPPPSSPSPSPCRPRQRPKHLSHPRCELRLYLQPDAVEPGAVAALPGQRVLCRIRTRTRLENNNGGGGEKSGEDNNRDFAVKAAAPTLKRTESKNSAVPTGGGGDEGSESLDGGNLMAGTVAKAKTKLSAELPPPLPTTNTTVVATGAVTAARSDALLPANTVSESPSPPWSSSATPSVWVEGVVLRVRVRSEHDDADKDDDDDDDDDCGETGGCPSTAADRSSLVPDQAAAEMSSSSRYMYEVQLDGDAFLDERRNDNVGGGDNDDDGVGDDELVDMEPQRASTTAVVDTPTSSAAAAAPPAAAAVAIATATELPGVAVGGGSDDARFPCRGVCAGEFVTVPGSRLKLLRARGLGGRADHTGGACGQGGGSGVMGEVSATYFDWPWSRYW